MNDSVPFLSWIGAWLGKGETTAGAPLIVQAVVEPTLLDLALRLRVNAADKGGAAVHAFIAAIGRALDGRIRAAGLAMKLGHLVLEQTPDDDGVLALAGTTLDGGHVSVSLIQLDENQMRFTLRHDAGGGFSAELRRIVPA